MERLSSKCKSFITNQLRLAWRYYSEARKECLKSKVCISCKQRRQRIYADHIEPVGSFIPEENRYVTRLFCSRDNLQPLCKKCHSIKTSKERKERKKILKKSSTED